MYDRATFFAVVRDAPFNGVLAQSQVDGISAILDEAERRVGLDPRHLAYMLSTAFHETARTMQPIAEYRHGKGRSYGAPDPATGQTYYGRGLVQLTHKANYAKCSPLVGFDLVSHPELALRDDVAIKIMFVGMLTGLFTGKKLSDYIAGSLCDYGGARRIINGTDRASLIAGYASAFETALRAASAIQAKQSSLSSRMAGLAPGPKPAIVIPAAIVEPVPPQPSPPVAPARPGIFASIRNFFHRAA